MGRVVRTWTEKGSTIPVRTGWRFSVEPDNLQVHYGDGEYIRAVPEGLLGTIWAELMGMYELSLRNCLGPLGWSWWVYTPEQLEETLL